MFYAGAGIGSGPGIQVLISCNSIYVSNKKEKNHLSEGIACFYDMELD